MTMRLLFSIIALALAVAVFVLPSAVAAQYPCPAGPRPGERQIGVAPGGNGVAPVPLCVRDGQSQHQQQPQQPSRPTGYWQKTWGAIAPSPKGGVLGFSTGAKSGQEAGQRAMADCQAKGGKNCKVELTYHNQCAVMVLGTVNYYSASAATLPEAKSDGIRYCQEKDKGCRVHYTACTEPIFHKY